MSAKKCEYTAIIVEPRQHRALEFVLKNFTTLLDERWQFIVFHGNQNKEYTKNIVDNVAKEHRNNGKIIKIKTVNLKVDNLNGETYSDIFFDRTFYEYISTEMFLVFQTDTMINDKYCHYIYNYMEYDYVGSPWIFNGKVGNGGLSLRRKSKMLEILDIASLHVDGRIVCNEDHFFSVVGEIFTSINKPPFGLAMMFSVETVYSEVFFGVHNCWGYLPEKQMKTMINICNGLEELIELQK